MAMPSIGETLRTARLQKKATEETVAKVLKIKVERLRDLEENRFDRFAAPVYVRSFIRNYANYLEIDGMPLVQQYEQEFPEPERRPIFDAKEDNRAQTFIRHQPPAKAQGMALTSTGQVVLFAVIFFAAVGAIAMWVVFKTQSSASLNAAPAIEINTKSTITTNQEESNSMPLESSSAPTNSTNVNEPWKVSSPPHLDSALTFSNSTPTSVPGQPVHVP
jgi:cytoskeletal protein RodZ